MRHKLLDFLALFSTTGTLVCCVLPAIVAAIAGGAAVGAMISTFPWLIPLSKNKDWIFLIAGMLIALDLYLVYRSPKPKQCDIAEGAGCEINSIFSKKILIATIALYSVAAFFSYALAPLMNLFGGL